jgi:tetratricopeptide (TPR) repeat protein
MLAPTSAVVRQGAELAPDRYSYLSGLGFAMLAGGAALGVMRLVHRGTLGRPIGRATAVAGLAAIAGLGVTSWTLTEVWKDSETLWRWAVDSDPECSACHGKLGETALGGPGGASRAGEAEALLRRAIALRPDLPDAYFNLGTALVLQGRYADAEAPLRAYMERVPEVAAGPERLGLLYLVDSRYDTAIPLLRKALVRRPDASGVRGSQIQALQAHARELQAARRGAEADALLAEARALAAGDAAIGRGRSAHP